MRRRERTTESQRTQRNTQTEENVEDRTTEDVLTRMERCGRGRAKRKPRPHLSGRAKEVCLVYGEPESSEALAVSLRAKGFADVTVPDRGDVVEMG